MKWKSKPRPGSSTTRSWPSISVAVAVLSLGGCAADGDRPVASAAKPPPLKIEVALPEPGEADLYLVREGDKLRVGDPENQAFSLFPRPQGAFEFHELPAVLTDPLSAKGWEASQEGFGVILQGGKVVLAMRRLDRVSKDTVSSTSREYELAFGREPNSSIETGFTTYKFWEKDEIRFMLCATQSAESKLVLTVAVGNGKVMDALRMNKTFAARDEATARQQLTQTPAGS
ncbi:MAG TPA: hypothetical protein PLH94_11470 [Fimbriimonadaceae bacterium]|nr:hypothetical protein [Fimbriimonadaceae bacterium]